jgi:fucose 4-O-acetylase-like acetyltransferase
MPDTHNTVDRVNARLDGAAAPIAAAAAAGGVRDLHADWLKAAAIVGVVCIHAGLPFHDVFRFGVPVFVGLWAFYLEKALSRRRPETHARFLVQRMVELAVPYLAWTLLYIEKFYASRWSATPLHTIVGGWFGGYGWSGQYYFVILFQLTLLFPLLRRCVAQVPTLPVIAAGVALNVLAGYWLLDHRWIGAVGDRLFIYWIPYVVMGIALARGQFRRTPGLVMVAVLLLLAAPFETESPSEHSAYLASTVTIASLLLLVAAVAADRAAPARSNPGLLARGIAFMGRNTFAIFVGNVAMLEVLKSTGFTPSAVSRAGQLGLLAVVAATLAGCLCIGWLLKRLGQGILVGKP